jgi:hypothetical protein
MVTALRLGKIKSVSYNDETLQYTTMSVKVKGKVVPVLNQVPHHEDVSLA